MFYRCFNWIYGGSRMTPDEIKDTYITLNDNDAFEVFFQYDVPDTDIIRTLGIDVNKAFYEWIYRTQK